MRLPIAAKILIVLFLIFSVVLAVSLVYQNNQQKTLVTDIVGEQTLDKASNYFDSLNMMMLTGTIHQKEALRQKVLEQNGIEDARVIRADGITSISAPATRNRQLQTVSTNVLWAGKPSSRMSPVIMAPGLSSRCQ